MDKHCVATWHFRRGGENCLLRLNIADNSLVTSGQYCQVLAGTNEVNPDDLDNFGWNELPDTLTWLRAKFEELIVHGWVPTHTTGAVDDHDIAVTATAPSKLAPWNGTSETIHPAIL